MELYYDAFLDLTTCRAEGGPITWLAMRDYALTFEFDREQTEDLFYFIRRMDEFYLEWSKPKSE